MSLDLDSLDMQPLSRVAPGAYNIWGDQTKMARRPKCAIKIAECIGEWTEIETCLGQLLGLVLHASPRAALDIFSSLENRSAQMRILSAAVECEVDQEKKDLFAVLMSLYIRPSMKERDRLAHWCWGHTEELPEDLLLAPPAKKILMHFQFVSDKFAETSPLPDEEIFVVTADDLSRMSDRIKKAKELLLLFMGAVWVDNPKDGRDECIRLLAAEPLIRGRLDQILADRLKNPKPPQ